MGLLEKLQRADLLFTFYDTQLSLIAKNYSKKVEGVGISLFGQKWESVMMFSRSVRLSKLEDNRRWEEVEWNGRCWAVFGVSRSLS